MIPSSQEVLFRSYGAWQLARFNLAGVQYFEAATDAALRSFFAAVLVAPAFIFMTLLSTGERTTELDAFPVVLIYGLSYCLDWVVFPVVAYHICQTIDREKAFFRFLSANNWASMVSYHLQLVVLIVIFGEFLPEALRTLLGLSAYGYLIAYHWFVARQCLDVSAPGAVGFVALQFVIAFFIQALAAGIIYTG